MINLLPKDEKRQLYAARTNTLLVRYNIALAASITFLGLAMAVAYFYLNTAMATSRQTIIDNEARATGYATIQSQAEVFRSNLSTAKQILDAEVAYTKVTIAIAGLMPPGTILDKLNLDSSTFGTPTVLTAQAKNYDNALALKDAFQKSSLFSDVHFQSITTGGTGEASGYPYTVSLNVTIKKEAAK